MHCFLQSLYMVGGFVGHLLERYFEHTRHWSPKCWLTLSAPLFNESSLCSGHLGLTCHSQWQVAEWEVDISKNHVTLDLELLAHPFSLSYKCKDGLYRSFSWPPLPTNLSFSFSMGSHRNVKRVTNMNGAIVQNRRVYPGYSKFICKWKKMIACYRQMNWKNHHFRKFRLIWLLFVPFLLLLDIHN